MAEFVLTLIAARDMRARFDEAIGATAGSLTEIGARVGTPDRLGPVACDLPFDGVAVAPAERATRAALAMPIDLVAQPAAGRRKRLLVADLESTIIENEMLEELAESVGLRAEVAEITRRAMNGEIDFADAVRARVALLKGLPARVLDDAAARMRVTPGAAALVATMRAHGARTALVTGGFGVFAERIRAALGFDVAVANELELDAGRLAGTVREPILGREAKLDTLLRLARELNIPATAALAVGDGANDLPMIEAAGLGVAYRGKPAVAARARMRVDHADLTALLYIQGYHGAEFVAS